MQDARSEVRGGYNEDVNSASYSVSDISYTGDAKAGEQLDLSKIQITLTCSEENNSNQTYSYNPQEAYNYLKRKNASFFLTIAADGEKIVSFGGGDENFPETDNPFTFDAGAVEISISGTIGGNEVSNSCDISVEGNSQGGGNENPPTTNPEEPVKPNKRAENYEALLKMILGEEKYNEIKANLENMELTAALIKEVGEKYPAIMTTDEHDETVREYGAGFVAQAEKYINITIWRKRIPAVLKASSNYEEMEGWRDEYAENLVNNTVYKINEYENEISFIGSFDLREISFPENNGKGKFSEARLTYSNPIAVDNNKFYVDIEQVNKIINIKGTNETTRDSLPTLEFNDILDEVKPKEIYNLYKRYQDKGELKKLVLHSDLSVVAMDGREISGNKDYTLFTDDGNKAKLSTDTSITSLTADALVQMYKQLTIYQIWNVIISGDATKEDTVNWELRNVVFEGDMSKIKNNARDPGPNGGNGMPMYGIVYFKNKPYNSVSGQTGEGMMITGQYVEGMIKLDKLEGVSSEYFKVNFGSHYYSVFDIRNVKPDVVDNYNDNEILGMGGDIQAIYFHKDFNVYKDNQEEINKLTYRFSNPARQGVFNVYLGEDRVKGYDYDSDRYQASSKTPRTLKEFEYFGNTYDNLYGDTMMQFENSAKESYKGNFEGLEEKELNSLNTDATTGLMNGRKNLLAKNDRRIEFIA